MNIDSRTASDIARSTYKIDNQIPVGTEEFDRRDPTISDRNELTEAAPGQRCRVVQTGSFEPGTAEGVPANEVFLSPEA